MKTPLLSALITAATLAAPALASQKADDESPVKLSVKADRPLLHRKAGPQEVIICIDVEGIGTAPRLTRQPLNLAVVLDRSGSMRGAKLEQARQAAEMVVDQLGPDDYFSLVIYDTEVEVIVPPQHIRKNAESIRRQIRRIQPGGSTALYHGVETGGRQLAEFFDDEKINRVLLLSDGIANVGPSSNREIAQLGTRLADGGMSVTTIGLGDDYNEDLMTALAEASDANYYYVADVEALPEVFESELGELKKVIAHRLEIEISFPEGVEPLEVLGRPETISHRQCRIRFGTLATDQSREIYVACRIDPEKARQQALTAITAKLNYHDNTGASESISGSASVKAVDDADLAGKSHVAAITARAEVFRNAAATERAIALADSGNVEAARKSIDSQIIRLRQAQQAAPAAEAKVLEEEIGVLRESQDSFEGEQLSKTGRKALQWNIFRRKNSKDESFGKR